MRSLLLYSVMCSMPDGVQHKDTLLPPKAHTQLHLHSILVMPPHIVYLYTEIWIDEYVMYQGDANEFASSLCVTEQKLSESTRAKPCAQQILQLWIEIFLAFQPQNPKSTTRHAPNRTFTQSECMQNSSELYIICKIWNLLSIHNPSNACFRHRYRYLLYL